MKSSPWKILYVTLFCAALPPAAALADHSATSAEIRFSGSSTLHDFEGTVKSEPFTATFVEDQETGTITVCAAAGLHVGDMTTDNSKRDNNMFKMLDLAHFKRIEGHMENVVLPVEGSSQALLHLKIRDVEHDVTATISKVERNGNEVSCLMKFPVSLRDFNLKGPSVLGLIRVGDTVYVECSIKGSTDAAVAGN
jgi:polyisoprenoid-binding protein YceI